MIDTYRYHESMVDKWENKWWVHTNHKFAWSGVSVITLTMGMNRQESQHGAMKSIGLMGVFLAPDDDPYVFQWIDTTRKGLFVLLLARAPLFHMCTHYTYCIMVLWDVSHF